MPMFPGMRIILGCLAHTTCPTVQEILHVSRQPIQTWESNNQRGIFSYSTLVGALQTNTELVNPTTLAVQFMLGKMGFEGFKAL
jgi:hypothetical protein